MVQGPLASPLEQILRLLEVVWLPVDSCQETWPRPERPPI